MINNYDGGAIRSKKKVVVIIQARMSSTRLPGKVLKRIKDKPMLWHVVNRVKSTNRVNKVVIATTTNKKDDRIEAFCFENRINFYRGSEKDVLDRYYHCAKLSKADIVVRITCDNPFIDPQIIDLVISAYLKNINNYSGASNVIERTYPRGLDTEVFSFDILEIAWKEAKRDYQREHVTNYLYENPERFKLLSVKNKKDLSNFRWTVDEQRDFEFAKIVYDKLYRDKKIFFMKEILDLIEKDPYLANINSDIEQKKILK